MTDQEYQMLTAAWLIRDPDFARKWIDHVRPYIGHLMGHYTLQNLCKWALDYFAVTGELLPAPALRVNVAQQVPLGGARQEHLARIEEVFALELVARDHIEATLPEQVRRHIIMHTEHPEKFDQPSIEEYIRQLRIALDVGTKGGPLLISEVSSKVPILNGIPTPWPSINSALLEAGGLCAGELGVVQGPTSVGKTRALLNIGKFTAESGNPTLFVFHEGNPARIKQRLDKLCGRPSEEVFGAPPKPVLALRYSPTGDGYGPEQIDRELDQLESKLGVKFKLVIRDYGELAATGQGDWKAILQSYVDFQSMLGRRGIPGWDALQENRFGDVSYFNVLKPATLVLELRMQAPGFMTLRISKNREGLKDIVIPIRLDEASGSMVERLSGANLDMTPLPTQVEDVLKAVAAEEERFRAHRQTTAAS